MKIISVNIAKRQRLNIPDSIVETGIYKKPITNKVAITKFGVEGDAIVDQTVHGGLDQAIYIYSHEDYQWWSQQLGREIAPGTFGENLTISGFDVDNLVIGDRLQINNVLLEISAPRTPCFKLAFVMNDPTFGKQFAKAAKPGAYARVLSEGELETGDPVSLIKTHQNYPTVKEIFIAWHSKNPSQDIFIRALQAPLGAVHRGRILTWVRDGVN
jgi:MOSC domain-containing protein YiiM